MGKRGGAIRTGFTQKVMCEPAYETKRCPLDHGGEKSTQGGGNSYLEEWRQDRAEYAQDSTSYFGWWEGCEVRKERRLKRGESGSEDQGQ